jgi:hypothetical protein
VLDTGLGLGLRQLRLERLGRDLLGNVHDEDVTVRDELSPVGKVELGSQNLGPGREALDRHDDVLGDGGREHLELDGLGVDGDDGLGGCLTLGRHRHVYGDLLVSADHNQVDMLDDRLDRVALDVLRKRELGPAVDLDVEERVGGLESHHRVVSRQGDVDRSGPVPIEDGRDLVVTTDLARRPLAEPGTGLGNELDLGHGERLLMSVAGRER